MYLLSQPERTQTKARISHEPEKFFEENQKRQIPEGLRNDCI
jgi:hypothetical protein